MSSKSSKNPSTEQLASAYISVEVQAALELLQQPLLEMEGGVQLYAQVQQILMDFELSRFHTEQAYSCFLNLLLDASSSQIPPDSYLFSQLEKAHASISPPLSMEETGSMYHAVQQAAEQLRQSGILNIEQVSLILSPVLMEYTNAIEQGDNHFIRYMKQQKEEILQFTNQLIREQRNSRSGSSKQSGGERVEKSDGKASTLSDDQVRRILREPDKFAFDMLDSLKSSDQLEQDRAKIQNLQRDFLEQMQKSVKQMASFGDQIEIEIRAIDSVTEIKDVMHYKSAVISTLESLKKRHASLSNNYETAQRYLSALESDSLKILDELNKVRVLSLTDELTSLPNRRAFLKRLETEVSRVKRYRNPLSIVIIDLDHFKHINDRYGHGAGDAVLQAYAEKVFTMFRHHDLIARYGGEEFVVLFPNTDLSGVLLALQKIQLKSMDLSVQISHGDIPLPTFSAGVAEYKQGETTDSFLGRADKALYRAKEAGRGRIEVSRNQVSGVEMEMEPPPEQVQVTKRSQGPHQSEPQAQRPAATQNEKRPENTGRPSPQKTEA